MKTFIALFRGINVGGSGVLPMRDLVETLESIDLKEVRTYIQSGNVAFRCSEENTTRISVGIGAAIRERFGFEPQVLVLKPEGVGRSKLAAGIERLLGVPAGGRNWRTVTKVMELASG
jgi:uncharacterized protein (DUF1697 family)